MPQYPLFDHYTHESSNAQAVGVQEARIRDYAPAQATEGFSGRVTGSLQCAGVGQLILVYQTINAELSTHSSNWRGSDLKSL